jgi:hypothetical protein
MPPRWSSTARGVDAHPCGATDEREGQVKEKALPDMVRNTLGDLSVLTTRPDATPTFASYVAQWLVAVRGRLKDGTAERYAFVMQHNWVSALGKQTLPAITREGIKRALSGWLASGACSKTVQLRLSVLTACLRPLWRMACWRRTRPHGWASGRSAPATPPARWRSSHAPNSGPLSRRPSGNAPSGRLVCCYWPGLASASGRRSCSAGTTWTSPAAP